jgi:hypothetical protein
MSIPRIIKAIRLCMQRKIKRNILCVFFFKMDFRYAFHPEVVDFLISQGAANANIRNNGNIRPIEAAMLSSSSKIEMAYDAPVQNKQTCGLTIK